MAAYTGGTFVDPEINQPAGNGPADQRETTHMASSRTYPSTVAIIPARRASKGIPRKNLLPLCGRPMLAWTIESACQAKAVQRVFVSTNDQEIAQIARRFGAAVVDRPASLSGDQAGSEGALLHAIETIGRSTGERPELLVFAQCTSPLTAPDDIDALVDTLLDQQADSALTATSFHGFIWTKGEGGTVEAVNHPRDHRPLRQNRQPQFLENGAAYAMRTEGFLKAGYRFFGKVVMAAMPAERSFELDHPEDVPILRMLMQAELRRRRGSLLPDPVAAVVLDFDGVMTDNRVTVAQESAESVVCNRSDGMGIAMLQEAGIPIVVLSTEVNPVVSARCGKLGVECLQGQRDKLGALKRWLQERQRDPRQVIYVGNDVNDLECMTYVGYPVAVADAETPALEAARLVLSRPGGGGAVRELVDLILEQTSREGP